MDQRDDAILNILKDHESLTFAEIVDRYNSDVESMGSSSLRRRVNLLKEKGLISCMDTVWPPRYSLGHTDKKLALDERSVLSMFVKNQEVSTYEACVYLTRSEYGDPSYPYWRQRTSTLLRTMEKKGLIEKTSTVAMPHSAHRLGVYMMTADGFRRWRELQ